MPSATVETPTIPPQERGVPQPDQATAKTAVGTLGAKVLIISQDDKEIAEIKEFLRKMASLPEEKILVAGTLVDAREKFIEHADTLKIVFPSVSVPASATDDIFWLTAQIATGDWVVKDKHLLIACSQDDQLYDAGCQTHFGHDQYQSLTYVVRVHLQRK